VDQRQPRRQRETTRSAHPEPRPPTAEQAARISTEAWKDPGWGMFVWLAMMTGARRGELCALAWDRINFATGGLTIRTSIARPTGHLRGPMDTASEHDAPYRALP
jgi:integrase